MPKIEKWSRDQSEEGNDNRIFWSHDDFENVTASIVERDTIDGTQYFLSVLDDRDGREQERVPIEGSNLSEVKDEAREWLSEHPNGAFGNTFAEEFMDLVYDNSMEIGGSPYRPYDNNIVGVVANGEGSFDSESIDKIRDLASNVGSDFDFDVNRRRDEITVTFH